MSITITPDQLRAVAPRCPNPTTWAAALNAAMQQYGIAADVDYVVNFLAQCAHESAQFTRLEEGLYYTADRLMAVWPGRFPTLDAAAPYAGQPQKLANFVYANRMGNGPSESYDGWMYRGRGIIMTTGLEGYRKADGLVPGLSLVTYPQRLATASVAVRVAAAWWASNPRLNALADDTATDDDAADLVSMTRIVNGGAVGLAERARLRDAFNRALTSTG